MNAPFLYSQLVEDIAAAIACGSLAAGSRLPSVRRCAAERGISFNTVTMAYRQLEDRGLIEARPQSGYFVKSALGQPAQPLRHSPATITPTRESEQLVAMVLAAQAHGDHVNLALACPDGEHFYPADKLARLTAGLLRRQPGLVGRYALPPGPGRLPQQIARRGLALGMHLPPDDILITHGAMEALQLALRAVTQPGDTVGVESPTYFNLYPLLVSLGLKVLEIPTHPQTGLSLDALELLLAEKRLAAILAMPTVQNPLGCTMPLDAKRRLAELLRQYEVPLIEDALYAELQFGEALSPTVQSFDRDGWVMICASYTKTLAPDYRIGWLYAGRFAARVRELKFASSIAESALLSEAVGLFLEAGHYDSHLRGLRRRYAQNIDRMRGLIAAHFPAGTTATQPAGGFLLWLELPPQVDALTLFHAALAEKIVVTPGNLYSSGSRYRHCLRISCCHEMNERFVAALRRLGELAQAQASGGQPQIQ
ncbi:aminotransferase-like domain-containing protein [Chitinilyticum litopenaei]|uniref:aminotransferase-like domain-containing protein n=1 Tax=Chitinilyticum litopenaei TaxID=1121276 RepID=UPI000407889C|nr:PLP-dependent aminotransferase family protein [Chitinilyticum litopenaei]